MMRAFSVLLIAIIVCGSTSASPLPAKRTLPAEAEPETSEQINCSHQEHPCVSKGQLPHVDGNCYTPLDRGPCRKGLVIVLDTSVGAKGMRGVCEVQRCPSGLVPFEGSCLTQEKGREMLCASGNVYLDPMGNPLCGEFVGWTRLLRNYVKCSQRKKRQVQMGKFFPSKRVTWVHSALCATHNSGGCSKSVSGVNPRLILRSEK